METIEQKVVQAEVTLKKGIEAGLHNGVLREAQLGFTTDTQRLFVGYVDEKGTIAIKEVGDTKALLQGIAEAKESAKGATEQGLLTEGKVQTQASTLSEHSTAISENAATLTEQANTIAAQAENITEQANKIASQDDKLAEQDKKVSDLEAALEAEKGKNTDLLEKLTMLTTNHEQLRKDFDSYKNGPVDGGVL